MTRLLAYPHMRELSSLGLRAVAPTTAFQLRPAPARVVPPKTLWAGEEDEKCYPCTQSNLLPIFPGAHRNNDLILPQVSSRTAVTHSHPTPKAPMSPPSCAVPTQGEQSCRL
jgi:hypothetical protein